MRTPCVSLARVSFAVLMWSMFAAIPAAAQCGSSSPPVCGGSCPVDQVCAVVRGGDVGPSCACIPACSYDPNTAPSFDPALLTALNAEAESIGVIGDLPGPLPKPAAIRKLFKIANGFRRVEDDIQRSRSSTYIADLPGPLPRPSRAAAQALDGKEKALRELNKLEERINDATAAGTLSMAGADSLLTYVHTLRDAVGSLPGPLP